MKIGRRKEQVKQIDVLLDQYHQLHPYSASRPRAFLAKISILMQILALAHDHMRNKHKSDRHEAVFQLASQAYSVLGYCRVFEDAIRLKIDQEPPDQTDPDYVAEAAPTQQDPPGGAQVSDAASVIAVPGLDAVPLPISLQAMQGSLSHGQSTADIEHQYAGIEGADTPQELTPDARSAPGGPGLIATANPQGRANYERYMRRVNSYEDLNLFAAGWTLEES